MEEKLKLLEQVMRLMNEHNIEMVKFEGIKVQAFQSKRDNFPLVEGEEELDLIERAKKEKEEDDFFWSGE